MVCNDKRPRASIWVDMGRYGSIWVDIWVDMCAQQQQMHMHMQILRRRKDRHKSPLHPRGQRPKQKQNKHKQMQVGRKVLRTKPNARVHVHTVVCVQWFQL